MKTWLMVGLAVLALGAAGPAVAAPARPAALTDPDWPCQSIRIEHMSLATVWGGPPLGKFGSEWQKYPAATALAVKLAQRRVPLAAAKAEIAAFAKSAGDDRKDQLLAFMGALFAQLDHERAEVVQGLDRFGARQISYAAQIRSEITALHDAQDAQPPDQKKVSTLENKVYWDTRVFKSRKDMMSYACFVPDKIEQRLFALASTTASLLP